MALAANHVRVVQHGNAVMGERTQLVYDEETGMVGQKKTVVAQVPVEGGTWTCHSRYRASASWTSGNL